MLVVADGAIPYARGVLSIPDARFHYFEHGPTRAHGNAQRAFAIKRASKDFLMFVDDDDNVVPGAIRNIIKPALAAQPDRPHIFRWRGGPSGELLFTKIGGAMFYPPNVPSKLGTWDDIDGTQDWTFIRQTMAHYPEGAVRHQDEVYEMSKNQPCSR